MERKMKRREKAVDSDNETVTVKKFPSTKSFFLLTIRKGMVEECGMLQAVAKAVINHFESLSPCYLTCF